MAAVADGVPGLTDEVAGTTDTLVESPKGQGEIVNVVTVLANGVAGMTQGVPFAVAGRPFAMPGTRGVMPDIRLFILTRFQTVSFRRLIPKRQLANMKETEYVDRYQSPATKRGPPSSVIEFKYLLL